MGDYLNKGWSMLELTVIASKSALPLITQTGYLSHFLDEGALKRPGGPIAFIRVWLDR
jgi:hypothetical protein